MKFPIRLQRSVYYFVALAIAVATTPTRGLCEIQLKTTRQTPHSSIPGCFHRVETPEAWNPSETAIIVCDVWDSHHCVNAVRRVQELAPRIDALTKTMRANGSTIIHAPSDCMAFYESSPARTRSKSVPMAANLPTDLNKWCERIPAEEGSSYPVDQSDGGEDDDLAEHAQWAKTLAAIGRNPKAPWKQQIPTIEIDERKDFVTDSGNEVWNILEANGIKHILICGVHTNMCVLGRPFGLRQLSSHGKQAVLIRDLTDTMYNPLRWPYVNHFSGTDLVIDHVEKFVCSTTTSDQLFRSLDNTVSPKFSLPHRFAGDKRPHLAVLVAEDEYETPNTLPAFANTHLRKSLRVSFVFGDMNDRASIPGLEAIDGADALLISVRRRPLLAADLQRIQRFVTSGKPVIGIRTASHAFCLRDGKQIEGLVQWPEFDAYAFGGHYTNHHGNELVASIRSQNAEKPLMKSNGSLYQVSPLGPGTSVIWTGKVDGHAEEPVAWTNVRPDSGLSFYTSLGHKTDFEHPGFRELLANAVLNACGVSTVNGDQIEVQVKQYSEGKGRQR